ncbi:ADP/ATP-dependent (S)-NAD(P)H-hydrate dehydratase [Cryobacterium sp. TMS1-13-1]|uniref:ADP-dependent NAD(P)H-hydrate dehydratase n=1 Tax=Cryobacterium sp. TMS1-13-1 TaxID=1259220 RepID=UPI00106AE333|nr:ADP/ATP-dependent (S)-NAD(P)H-hydrate dehydratase [Cryobacterium sp. TMS1-13-1]TFD24115.1 NAD(P)H-hydrate dehydratase [Cryobacterium sp. TMS1-13-1]
MVKPRGWLEWEAEQARDWIARPQAGDDKYSRGVLGVRTGSKDYPGAAVLGVDAAVRTGVGMVRYLGPRRARDLVLQRRPEIVTLPGRVQAWLLGSGINAATRTDAVSAALDEALAEGLPTVIDAGALDLVSHAIGPTVITPHAGELAAMLEGEAKPGSASQIAANPGEWAIRAARLFDVTVLLKGAVTHVASPAGARLTVSTGPAWLATAGSGDVLGGILGALLATHSDQLEADAASLAPLAATAALIHAEAANLASAGGPIAALDVADAVPRAVAAFLDYGIAPGARPAR